MKAEIISIGTELLLGDVLNTNAQFLSKRLMTLGIDVYRQVTLGDNGGRLKEELTDALSKVDLIITTGGLGPTVDDITKEVCADALGLSLVLHEESYQKIVAYFKNPDAIEANINQAMFPENSIVLRNPWGTAPGCIMENSDGIRVVLLPGPPREMEPLFDLEVYPILKKDSTYVIHSKEVYISGYGEWEMAKIASSLMNSANPTVAPYAGKKGTYLRVTAKGTSIVECEALIAPIVHRIEALFGEHVYGYDGDTREGALIALLKDKGLVIATAESLTGGLVASTLVNVPGASDVLQESYVTYSDEAKHRILGVSLDSLERYSAVSEKVCYEMATGLYHRSQCDVGIVTTGYAGPYGEEVGMVFIGTVIGGKVRVRKERYSGDRSTIRRRTAIRGIDYARLDLMKSECFT